MNIEKNKSLKNLNTFGVDVSAKFFVEIKSVEEFKNILDAPEFKNNEHLFLGVGSNVLFTKNFDGFVIKNNLKGIEVVKEDNDFVWVRGMSGENWHDFVVYCVDQGWGGIENMSLIPGTVGAAPVQNIGAYGSELKDTLDSLEAIELKTGKEKIFSNEECKFGYRTSVFKTEDKGKYFITATTFKLRKVPNINTAYGSIQEKLEEMGIKNPTAKQVSDAVIQIRKSKLPDFKEIGSAGSFFKNPHIEKEVFETIHSKYTDMPFYELPNGLIKIPAGWLIEQVGWKGKRVGNAGVHNDQALVLVNHGGATGNEIYQLSKDIQKSVKEKFNVDLETEVTIV